LGLGLGIILGRQWLGVPLSPLLWAVVAACVVVPLVATKTEGTGGELPFAAPRARGQVALILVLLSFSVAVRSLVGTVGCDGCPRGLFLLSAIPFVAFAGKLSGGFLADRFGFIDLSMVALLASGPLLAFAGGDLWLALPGLLIFQMTMPVTLAAALRALPAWPGLGFGILCLALVAGTLPAYVPGGWRPQGIALLLLVLASAAALYAALRLLLHPRPRAAVAVPDPPASHLCRGLP
jgi:FSR family fosmidomycin resistance protein-like MFS transporter